MPGGPDIRDVPVTAVVMEFDLRFSGGTVSDEGVTRVWREMLRAFERIASENGLKYGWLGTLSCGQPKQFDRLIERRGLVLEAPKAVAAVRERSI